MHSNYVTIWEAVADEIGDHDAIVQGARRLSWRDYEQRAARLAHALVAAGLGPGSKVGIYLYNSPEYAEVNFAALKLRGVPINVNFRYLADELHYVLDNADVEALVFHRSLGEHVGRVRDRLPKLRLLVEVGDSPPADGPQRVASASDYESLIAGFSPAERIAPQGDELYMFYTGGTTGMPKGVMYPLHEFTEFFANGYQTLLGLDPLDSTGLPDYARQLVEAGTPHVALSTPPLMHATGCWLGMMTPQLLGATAVLLEQRHFDAIEVWDVIQREGVQQTIIVGDAFARPMLRALDDEPDRWDASSLRLLISSGALLSLESKRGLLAHLPGLAIVDLLGSTEGGMGRSIMTNDTSAAETARFAPMTKTKVFTEDGREVQPGSEEIGMVATGGFVPIGYYKDPETSARTFREIAGDRWAFPGDMATVAADGSLVFYGRGSNCINTGGEKVFPEEVESALKLHPAVEDALVFGVPDDRFGSRVVGLASLRPGASATADEVVAATRQRLSSYKLPRQLSMVDRVPRSPNGKADYPAARALFAEHGS